MKGKILVTGGTGYIGSHTVVELMQAGYGVVVIDNLSNSKIEVLDGIKKITGAAPGFFQIDLSNEEAAFAFFQGNKDIQAVIHFAAFKAVGESVEKPLEYYRNNLSSLINLLVGMNSIGLQNLVFSSSCTVYGQPDELPVTEKAPIKIAESPYGNTKQICEEIIEDTVKTGSAKAISLRYFNPIGAHASANIGELPIGTPNNLVPYITQTAIGKREILTVYGNDYPTKDGTCIRDYIHVVDLAKAHVVAVERLLTGKNKHPYEVFNLGTGNGFTVLEVINTFEKATGVPLNYRIGARRAGDVTAVYADTSFANHELGWKAQETLESMVQSAWEWQKKLGDRN